MKLDIFTFIAQIINFIILVVLLYYFLFKKIIRAIDQREETIRNEFEEAEKKKEEAELTIEEHKKQLNELDAQKEGLIKEAQTQANEEKVRLLEEAHTSISEKKEAWKKKLEREKTNFLKNLQKKIAEEVYSIAESVVEDLANVDLQKMIYRRFMEVMQTLPEEQIQSFHKVYSEAKEKTIHVLSSSEFSKEEKESIEQVLSRLLETKPVITYQIDSIQFLGISLRIGGFQLNWSVKNYFDKLKDKFEKVLAETNA